MPKNLPTVRTVKNLRQRVAGWRRKKQTVALVPTMGALHEGHLSLVRLAKKTCKRVVVSIFVNPSQFAPSEDFSSYPRDEAGDRKQLLSVGADLIFAPGVAEMYPPFSSTQVNVGGLSEGLCGASRPHFFSGVATVVAKLLLQCAPDVAIFGEKDYQQLKVIERMARDLNIPTRIVGAPIMRETDGLAMSSRNAYLTSEERVAAPLLNRTLRSVASDILEGRAIDEALAAGRVRLENGRFRVDYLELRDGETLAPVTGELPDKARLFVAAFLGRTRLIDNIPVRRAKKKRKARA